MDEIGARALVDRASEGFRVGVEVAAERGEERFDRISVHRHDESDVEGRAGLAAEGARQRSADEVLHAARVEGLGDAESDAERIGDQGSTTSHPEISG